MRNVQSYIPVGIFMVEDMVSFVMDMTIATTSISIGDGAVIATVIMP